ncbi:MAG TPA: di-heme oxidoredictase family protein [Planctomycetota bacterium]|nr:di-heme oxidoredictase family protein [Planctomycetota bacterium]
MLSSRTARFSGTSKRALAAACVLTLGATSYAISGLPDLTLVEQLHTAAGEHLEQSELLALVQQSQGARAFDLAFEHGNELFETTFNALDGVGADVGDGQRFTRLPRADQQGPGEWGAHVPERTTGPNAPSCTSCHNNPADDGAGGAENNVIRDPFHWANPRRMLQRNTPHLFGAGALQRLAEEMTIELLAIRAALHAQVQQTGVAATAPLASKGVSYGTLRAYRSWWSSHVNFDFSQVEGIDNDLVVRPFQWKGSVAFLRDFNRGAAHNELGMQAVELVGYAFDGDHDHVVDELTVGDMTALAVYIAAQPRPVTKRELASLGLIPALTPAEIASIQSGEAAFANIGCAECHRPTLVLADPIFREPAAHAKFRDALFPGSQNPVAEGVTPAFPVQFDLTQDQHDNVIVVGGQTVHLGSFVRTGTGTAATIALYGDLKRHRMGYGLAENIDETGRGASTFLTENLWGVGTTGPYLHDGRATTLTEAILAHGGEALAARQAFVALPLATQQDLIAFLGDLVLFKNE